MIKNLLNPKWQHADASIRLQAIEEGQLKDDILYQLAKTDPDPGVRTLAISRLQDLQQLIELADTGQDASNIADRLHDLILAADPQSVPDTQVLQRANALCKEERLRASLLLNAPYTALRQMMAEGLHQDDTLEQCALNDKAGEVRRAAVAQINDEDSLRRITRQLRGNDKTTARLADEKRARLQQRRENAAQRQQLLSGLQAYADGSEPLNPAGIDKLTRQWQALSDEADGEAQRQFDSLQAALQPLLEQHRSLLAQEREGRSQREAILQTLSELAEDSLQSDPEELVQRLAAERGRWKELGAMQNTATEQRFEQDFDEVARRINTTINQLHKQGDIQQRLDSTIAGLEALAGAKTLSPREVSKARAQSESLADSVEDKQTYEKPLQRIRNLVDKLDKRLAQQKTEEQTLRDQLKSHIDALESALEEKTLKAALSAHKKAHDLLIAAGDAHSASLKKLEQRLHHSEPALRELKSWRNWGTDHAREELIKEAVALRDAPPENVDKLAKNLSSLRKRWKQLGPLEPGGKALWEQFDATCTQAHEPVKTKHDADAEARRKHLEQRKAICAQLEELVSSTDWAEQPDWHELDKSMGAARRQWSKTGGVPHKAWPAIKKRFDRAIKDLDSHLAPERERNFSFRQGLVLKAEQLAQEQDNRAATAAARELRQQWQVTARSHNRKEKQIWQAFNKAMDQVFQKDRDARDQFRASLDENQHEAEALCEQLEQQARSDDPAIRSRRPELQQAREQFAALNLPKKTRRQLENRFDKACKAFEQRIKSANEALKQSQLDQLYELHRLCVQTEMIALGQPSDAQAASTLETRWAEATRPEKEKTGLRSIEQRYQAARAVINDEQPVDSLGDLTANADCRRTICTDLEILLHLESPAEDQKQRMQRQIELLESAMKGGDQNSPEKIRKLKLSYFDCGPAEPALQENLEDRFSKLLSTSPK